MTERERLAERIRSAMNWGWTEPSEIAERLIEDGDVIVLPCKVGAAVWCIVTKKSRSGLIFSYIKKTRMRWSNIERIIEGFGVTAFYTREEAEAALAERCK